MDFLSKLMLRNLYLYGIIFIASFSGVTAQPTIGLRCPKDAVLSCGTSCFDLNWFVPDIRESGQHYTVSRVGDNLLCYNAWPDLDADPGQILFNNLDDRFSAQLTLPFVFPFFDSLYNKMVVSTNGYISFDSTLANRFSHYGILASGSFLQTSSGNPVNLPSTLYDRRLIMGPYHDIDPSISTSPNRSIRYRVTGTAPNRFVRVSYFKVPLFGSNCNQLFENTSQISLHEATGIIDVFIKDKQVCNSWNKGRAMIGIQDHSRTRGLMAPGRYATDSPWGSPGMNEWWRFTPAAGASLLKSVQLLNSSGQVIAAGDTTSAGNGKMNVRFSNICVNGNAAQYIVRSIYRKFNDAQVEFAVNDTLNLSVQPQSLDVSVTNSCGARNDGVIKVTGPLGSEYVYSTNGGLTFSDSPTFAGVAQGFYTIAVKNLITGCVQSRVAMVGQDTLANAEIRYNKTVYCKTDSFSTAPLITGVPGGKFRVQPAGLVIDTLTGIIRPIASDTGRYQVTYVLPAASRCYTDTAVTTVQIADLTRFVWTGAQDSLWEHSANWSCGALPTSTSNVYIYSGNVLVSTNVVVNRLVVMPGATITVQPGANLQVLR